MWGIVKVHTRFCDVLGCFVVGWGTNRLDTDGGAGGGFRSVIVGVVIRRWIGQTVIGVGDVRTVP